MALSSPQHSGASSTPRASLRDDADTSIVAGAGSICIVRQHHRYEIATRREAEAYRDAGFEVDIIMLADPDNPGGPKVETIEGVHLHRVAGAPKSKGGAVAYLQDYLSFMVKAGSMLTKLHGQRHYQVVQVSTLPDFLLLAAQPARARGAKVLSFIKEPSPELGRTIYNNTKWDIPLKIFEQMAIRLADMVFTVTDEMRDTLVARGAKPAKTHVVMNGGGDEHWVLDLDKRPTPNPDLFTVICHGTIEHRYGHETIVDAVALLRDEMPELRLTLCGEGSYSDEIKKRITDKGIDDIVDYQGFVSHDELIDSICRADAGIVAQLASEYSHLVNTNKMFEYMMLRRPVIATKLSSVSTTFSDAEIEFYTPGDPSALAQAIRNLRTDPDRCSSLVANAGEAHKTRTAWAIQREQLIRQVTALAKTSKWWDR